MNKADMRKLLARLTRKWPAKVLSVAAAIALMAFYRMSTIETRFFPSHLQVLAGEFIPASSHTGVVRVDIRGEAASVSTIFEEDIQTILDLSGITEEGFHTVPVTVRRAGSAAGREPFEISVEPAEILVRLEQRISRNIPLVPVFRGTLAEGYEAGGQHLIPASVVAEGPRSALEALAAFETGVIDLEGRREDFTLALQIMNPHPFVVIMGGTAAEFRGIVRPVPPPPPPPAPALAEPDPLENGQEYGGAQSAGPPYGGLSSGGYYPYYLPQGGSGAGVD